MVTLHFKNVGQGDSIILEWEIAGEKRTGIIDCNIIDGNNPVLEHLIINKTSSIDFIILSHFHYDHFSGMADIFEYCVKNKIKVNTFYHSLTPFLSEIYNRIFTSQKLQKGIERFFSAYEIFDDFVKDKPPVSNYTKDLDLTNDIILSFLAPEGNVYEIMARQLSRKVNKITSSYADINRLSTIIKISNNTQAILLTSDAIKKSFIPLRQSITHEIILTQAPHHGSWSNIDEKFWNSIVKTNNCPIIFSVGNEPKDKLPNKETVAYFDSNGFDVYSTNSVFGINEYFGLASPGVKKKNSVLNSFSKLSNSPKKPQPSKYNGNHSFKLL